ncbi:MAG: hypothetical protein JWO31_707, partial [Phycisphaerales bacterium]|nr:hypothetical protein [Phycisphaerales bacterium]
GSPADAPPPARDGQVVPPPVSRAFVDLAGTVACHRDADRWNLLYRALWRLTHGERNLLERPTDDDTHRLTEMERAVRRDRHKMTAFVRFRLVGAAAGAEGGGDTGEHYVAWHRPDHYIVRLTAPFFARRFATLNWVILTPDDSAAWDGAELTFGPGLPESAAPAGDDLETLWQTYYANIFNPARIKLKAMKKELPVRHWPTLPETRLIPDLLHDAPRRVEEMIRKARQAARPGGDRPLPRPPADGAAIRGRVSRADVPPFSVTAAARNLFGESAGDPSHSDEANTAGGPDAGWGAGRFISGTLELPQLAAAAAGCRGCHLCDVGTKTVFGEGPAAARVMFVGEQPGDQEDHAGRPFVGPAGQLLDQALVDAGVDRGQCYVTNTVKHFKWEPRGTRRLHVKPNAREVSACLPWLEAEIRAVRPAIVVCLGSTAAQALLGRDFRVTTQRGQPAPSPWAPWTMATIHPSALLRTPDTAARAVGYRAFVADLKLVADELARAR